ncbi:MAG TPA: hypothetical protein VMF32_07120 [Xanthobacteraceae bacterium]|nr:hypothetical protein [Xanthobacteraceae bacterium]HUN98671.1 hypothetical protein [Bradyrhizobium sp.]
MSDAPAKRSHQLALDNVRRIAETLREERNNLTIMLQEQREVLKEATELMRALLNDVSPEHRERIEQLLERIGDL